MQVFYITGVSEDARKHFIEAQRVNPDAKCPRAVLAKFFKRKDAEAHVFKYRGWSDVQIDERAETLEMQHVAHGGKVGAEPSAR